MNGDAWAPAEIAAQVESGGVAKARNDTLTTLVLALLAGAFIALGATFYLVVVSGSNLGLGVTRLLGGLAFSTGLILVVVAGAELFTGNNLIAVAWASGRVTMRQLLRNWVLVYIGNVIGALGTVALVGLAGVDALGDGAVRATAIAVAQSKEQLGTVPAVALGMLCNTLVCLAVWLAIGGRTVTDKILAIVFPITAFVTIGAEHSIANWFFLPYAHTLNPAAADFMGGGAAHNLVAVTVGNMLGGTLLVAGVYWLAYLRPAKRADDSSAAD